MTELDRLPPDQRAVLSLVLERGRSYGEVADMLAIPESVVRDRAHGALDALAGASTPRAPRAGGSPEGRSPASSRLGGALLLGGIVAAIVVAVILLSGGGGKASSSPSSTPASTAPTNSTSTSSAAKPHIDKKLTLASVEPALKANGEAYVLSEGGRRAFYIAAQGLPPSSGFFYAVWLYNSPSSSAPLGRAPTVGSNGRMEGGGPLPSNARDYAKLIVTRETSTHAAHPGEIVLSGAFALR